MATILIVEDNISICLLIKTRLSSKYSILEAHDGVQALLMLEKNKADLLIVDVMMKGMNGFELVKNLRDNGNTVPVIMLTALSSMANKKKGFELGVDDYLTKPVDYDELMWRVEAILRRAKISISNQIIAGSLVLSRDKMSARWGEEEVFLTDKEFNLLFKLLSFPDVVFTKNQIMDEVWGYDSVADYSTIKTYINRLRNKFLTCKDFEIVSVRGLGYKALLKAKNE